MMLKQEKIFLKIAVIVSLVGMLILILISQKLEPQDKTSTAISSLEDLSLGTQVRVAGTITSVKDTPAVLILEVKDATASVTIIASKSEITAKLKKEMRVEVAGTLKEYKGKREIEASAIQVFK